MDGAEISFKEQVPLGKYTTFHIGGPAQYFFDAHGVDELVAAIAKGRAMGLPIFILGGGSNILIGDKGVRGLVIRNNARTITVRGMKGKRVAGQSDGEVYVEAESGALMNQLVRFTVQEGLRGLEMQLGLPGTVGGAVFMNAKWTHPPGAVGDVVYQAEILTPEGERRTVPAEYFRFGYDYSHIQKTHDIVLRVLFVLSTGAKNHLWDIATGSVKYRQGTQPQGVKTCGCAFQNISKAEALAVPTPNHTTSAGFLIDHAGCKGLRVGDAEVSQLHANFIVNRGAARARDVVELMDLVKERVKNAYGVTLKEELIRVGDF